MKTTLAAVALISGFSLPSAFAAETKDPVVSLITSKDTPFGSVVKILDTLKAVGVKNLSARITSTAETKSPSIVLTVDKETSWDSLIEILDACKAAGLNTISLRTTMTGETTK